MKKNTDKEDDSIWSDGFFMKTLISKESKEKMRTFNMKHNEEINFNCSKCNIRISAHNKDWHNGMCDSCFNKKYFKDN